MDVELALKALAIRRPIFHSEADFQHELAQELAKQAPGIDVRLEIPASYGEQARAFIDLLTHQNGKTTFFELKYKTLAIETQYENEPYSLKNQGAQDQGSYDFIKDIARIEHFVESRPNSEGYAIMLSNDQRYWKPRRKQNSIDAEFQLIDDRVLSGTFAWGQFAGVGSTKGRMSSIELRRKYPIQWKPFSHFSVQERLSFRYLSIHVTAETANTQNRLLHV